MRVKGLSTKGLEEKKIPHMVSELTWLDDKY